MRKRRCCYSEQYEDEPDVHCLDDAVREIYPLDGRPEGNTDACTAHVGALLTDAYEHRIFRLEGTDG